MLLRIALSASVPLRIADFQRRGGPDDADFERIRGFAQVLGEKGDVLQFGGKKKGEPAALFNQLADALAVMAFCPGGVKFGDEHWEAKRAGGMTIDHGLSLR
jgi:hypothetical protein